MVELRGRYTDIQRNFRTGKTTVTFEIDKDAEIISSTMESLSDKELTISVKQFHKKRSLNANAYAWALMSEIADLIRTSKEEVYEKMLEKYGTTLKDDEGNAVIYSIKADIGVDFQDIGLHAQKIGVGNVEDKLFYHYRVIKGSSNYNSREMAIFLDGVVSECHSLGIDTITDEEVRRLENVYGKVNNNATASMYDVR